MLKRSVADRKMAALVKGRDLVSGTRRLIPRMADRFTLSPFEFFVRHTRTRFPFRYGIASMTDVPHLFVRTRVTVAGKSSFGLSAEGLPPKWFTKNPATTFEQDLPEMLEVISHAAKLAEQIAQRRFRFSISGASWIASKATGPNARHIPPLLANLGVSLVERAVLDGLCRLAGEPLHRMVATNRLGLRLGEIYAELGGAQPRDLLPAAPLASCFVRHTVGLGDALVARRTFRRTNAWTTVCRRIWKASIRAYGLRYFKVKLCGDAERDLARLRDTESSA